jgi:hypothetical protein
MRLHLLAEREKVVRFAIFYKTTQRLDIYKTGKNHCDQHCIVSIHHYRLKHHHHYYHHHGNCDHLYHHHHGHCDHLYHHHHGHCDHLYHHKHQEFHLLHFSVSGLYINPTNARLSGEEFTLKRKDPNLPNDQFEPQLSSFSGANYWDRDTNLLYVVVRGSEPIDIRTSPVIQVKIYAC